MQNDGVPGLWEFEFIKWDIISNDVVDLVARAKVWKKTVGVYEWRAKFMQV